jgi:hypothetical protein
VFRQANDDSVPEATPPGTPDRGEPRRALTVNDDAAQQARELEKAAEQEAERLARHLTQDPELREEWLRQDNLIYGGLVAVGLVFVQALLPYPLDPSAMICILGFAVAIPLLAALIMVNRQEQFRRRRTSSRTVVGAKAIAQGAAFLGLVAGFWHVDWIAGAVVLGSSLIALGVHSAGFTALELPSTPDQEEPPGRQRSEQGDADNS